MEKDKYVWIQSSENKTTYTMYFNNFRVSVHKYIGCSDMLFMSCHKFDIECLDLKTTNIDEAKKSAIILLKAYIYNLKSEIDKVD
jgi:hypothetical protein